MSSSMADAIEFLHEVDISDFEDAAGTVEFLCQIDRIFDFLSSSSVFAKGDKKPVSAKALFHIGQLLSRRQDYLKQLTDSWGNIMVHHPKKAFVQGFIMS